MDVTHLSKSIYEGFIVVLSASASSAHPQTGMSMEFQVRRAIGTPCPSVPPDLRSGPHRHAQVLGVPTLYNTSYPAAFSPICMLSLAADIDLFSSA